MDDYSVQFYNFFLYNGDCNQVLHSLISEKVDMIFADPPYFLSQGNRTVNINGRYVNFDKGDWDRVRPQIKYMLRYLRRW